MTRLSPGPEYETAAYRLFERCGIAALSDIQTSQWRDLFDNLERDQAAFLSHQGEFRTTQYKWPLDALHTWSRVWEYPYVYFHLASWRRTYSGLTLPKVADIGSGVTFFPFSVARLGFHVICSDPDPVCGRELALATSVVEHMPGEIRFRRIANATLPFENAECDVIYCISVLEHVEDFTTTLAEISRCLKPRGLFCLTTDLDLQGNADISVERYTVLVTAINDFFDPLFPQTSIHPADLLTNVTGPYPMYTVTRTTKAYHFFKQELVKGFLGLPPRPLLPWHLAVQGWVLRKRA
jgi:2-polyprenyl-3-methyl-5-hydroxy-6-metoxy-1,4-benzoquinol methylase